MEKRKWSFYQMIALWVFSGLLIQGYIPGPIWAQTEIKKTDIRVQKIALMPFLKGFYAVKINEAIDSPLSQAFSNPGNISAEGDQILTRYVHRALRDRLGDKVIPLLDCYKAYDQMAKDNMKDTPRLLAVKVGKALGANLIMAGHVWRYKERIGGSYGVESPASVAFAIHLIDAASGKRLWSAKFDETQQALSENILSVKAFFQRKGKWLTANELARYGIEEIFKKAPF